MKKDKQLSYWICVLGCLLMGYVLITELLGNAFDAQRIVKYGLGILLLIFPYHQRDSLFKFFSPSTYVIYGLFIIASMYGATRFELYNVWQHYDSFLHLFSGAALTRAGFDIATNTENNQMTKTISLVFAFGFAMSVGIFWEIFEYSGDALFDMNMQRYAGLQGHRALYDTMKDYVCNMNGSLLMTIVLRWELRKAHQLDTANVNV